LGECLIDGKLGFQFLYFVHFVSKCFLCLSSSVKLYKGKDRDDYEPKRHAKITEDGRGIMPEAKTGNEPASY
jgi:hypothetical protein